MLRAFDAVTELFLANLEQSQRRSSQAMQELSSGYKMSRPSDAPADVVTVLHVQSDVSRATQVQSNLNRLQNEVNISEGTIRTSISVMDRITVLGTQALGLAQTAETRSGILSQLRGLQTQLVGLTQLKVQGRYVFSGDKDGAAQYSLDATNTVTGVKRNFQTADTRQITDVLGSTFTAGLTAERLFDHRNTDDSVAADNVFAAIEQLAQGLANNDSDEIEQAMIAMDDAGAWLNTNLTFYGSVQNRITDSLAMANKYQIQWQTQLSQLRDADTAEAITTLETSRTQQEAALAAQANFGARSLFDFLR
ncbi:MAG TPA: flagellin [Bryobacteraceae bacterium]|nr:flagellin [Bryobacteraceae bacterium]